MPSKREDILAQLLVILEEVKDDLGAFSVFRNRGLMSNDKRPALALLDGNEDARLTGDRDRAQKITTSGHIRMTPQLMTMHPQIFVVLDSRKPQNENIGQDLNTYIDAVTIAIAKDATLLTLLGSNGSMALKSVETDLNSGDAAEGQAKLDFELTYVLDPYAL